MRDRLLEDFDRLPPELQDRARELVHSLAQPGIQGTPGEVLWRFAGTIDAESLREMEQAIEEGCEQVDLDGW